jgi:heavy metal sensor kinase
VNFTLRNRIAASFVLTVGILLAAVFVALYEVVQFSLYRHIDGDLEMEAIEVHKSIVVLSDQFVFANPYEWKEGEHKQAEVNPVFLQLVDTNGTVIRKSDNLRENQIPSSPRRDEKTFTNVILAGEPVRILQLPILSTQNRPLAYLSIASSSKQIDVVLGALGMALLILYPVCILVMFAVSRVIAGRSLAPVQTVIGTAERITRENLSLRIDLPRNKDELYVLASTVNQLLDRIGSALVREQQFTSDVAHELRTPLAALKGTLEVLIRKQRKPEEYEEKISDSILEVNRLSRLVDRLLMLARYESGTVSPILAQVDVTELAASVLQRLEPFIEVKKMQVRVDAESARFIRADRGMVEIMLENVLSNALKYSSEGSEVDIVSRENADRIELRIADHGMGMPEERVQRIFDRFYRAEDSRNSDVPGFGLGLAIVKSLADLQKVRLSVKSAVGDGTTVLMEFGREAS